MNCEKAVMIGCGNVGSACVFALMQSGLFSEIAMIDADRNKAEGEAMDISHGIPYAKTTNVYAGNYDDVRNASMVIITAGSNQRGNMSRLELLDKNVAIVKEIVSMVMRHHFDGVLLIVTNPVDVLSYVAMKVSGLPSSRVIGSGTVLDTARLKMELGHKLRIDNRSIHAFIIGEHGDSEIVVWSAANVYGIPLENFCMYEHVLDNYSFCNIEGETTKIAEDVRNVALEIIKKKKATYYGIAMAVKRICEAVMRNEHSVLPVSSLVKNQYGINDVYLSLPCIVGRNGIEAVMPLMLNDKELEGLKQSANTLNEVIRSCNEN